ncbi:hypothetical protein [Faecalimicrobium dakarense]|uniref:hypothetical protein n=1 Tax=Faecalimicrobium dakarense TaxID=1301100 RepID=UPI0004AF698F|nr:hypothetical protein [[Clostridium] dakarense]
MKNTFVSIVQKCICVDFLLNTLINSNSYQYLNFLSDMKSENLRNIKVICHLYEYIYCERLNLDDIEPLKLERSYEDKLHVLLKFNFNILSELEDLKKCSFNHYYFRLLQGLISSYLNFISFINCFCPITQSKKRDFEINNTTPYFKIDSHVLNYRFFYMVSAYNDENIPKNISIDFIRDVSIDAIDFFFDYSLLDNTISSEQHEIFFENNPENKFYQFFFKSNDKSFKIRVMDKDPSVFYMYQTSDNFVEIAPSINKNDIINFANDYIKEKFKDVYSDLVLDESYTNTSTYMETIESYKLKYNYKGDKGKINLTKGLYITVDARYLNIKEISLF